MEHVNLTPHAIVVYHSDGSTTTLPPSGQIARLVDPAGPLPVSTVGGLPAAIYSPLEGRRLEGLPDPRTGTLYVCSILCLGTARALGRLDVCAPDTDTGAVRVPRGEPNAGALLGTTRLLLAGDLPPAYRLVTGSVTHEWLPCPNCGGGAQAPCQVCGDPGWVPPVGGEFRGPRDLDVLGWSDAPVGREHRVFVSDGPIRQGLPLDYHEVEPELIAGEWVIRAPVWHAEEDPSRPTLLWHSPCARPVRVERQVLTTGPAQIRRYAATGVLPDFGPAATLPDHGQHGNLVVELRCDGDAPGYRGCGLLAWRRAAERLSEAQIAALPAHVREFLGALMAFGTDDLTDVAARASLVLETHRDRGVRQGPAEALENSLIRSDTAGTPGSSNSITYYWDPSEERWTTPYAFASGGQGYATFAEVLALWSE